MSHMITLWIVHANSLNWQLWNYNTHNTTRHHLHHVQTVNTHFFYLISFESRLFSLCLSFELAQSSGKKLMRFWMIQMSNLSFIGIFWFYHQSAIHIKQINDTIQMMCSRTVNWFDILIHSKRFRRAKQNKTETNAPFCRS